MGDSILPYGMQPSDLERAVSRQSWEWLFDLSRRLRVVVEAIDPGHVPVFPPGPSSGAATIRRMLTTGEPALAAAIAEVLHCGDPARASVDGLEVLCLGLTPAGVLVLAREITAESPADACREDLDLVGPWLAGAIDASLTKPPNAICVEPYRIASLRRILSEAVAGGTARKVVGAFVEALGVWDDVRIRSYAEGAIGGYFQYVSPVGTLRASMPAEIDAAAIPAGTRIVRLSREEIDRLKLGADAGDVLTLRLVTADITWLLIFSGAIDTREQVRLALYSDMLRESLNDVLAATTRRAVAGVPRHQLPPTEPLDGAADAALGQLAAIVGGRQAALVVAAGAGAQTLAVGNTDLLASFGEARLDRLVVTSSDAGSVMTLVIAREHGPFLAFEREIIRQAVTVLHPWVRAALQRSKDSERRRRFRPVDSLFDQLAAEAVDAGQQASVIVVSVNAAAHRPELVQSWLGRIRVQLRGGDFAGILSDTEIAVLLCDASAEQAAVVSARLKKLMEQDDGTGVPLQPAFGTTTRSPSAAFEGSLVGAARAGAAAVR